MSNTRKRPPARPIDGIERARRADTAPGASLRSARASAGGREHTAAEHADLLSGEGFRWTQLVPTAAAASTVEAVPA